MPDSSCQFCVESISCFPHVWRHFFHSPAKDSNLALEAVGILALSARHAVATRPVGSEVATLVGNHSVRKTQVSRDKCHRPLFLARRGYVGLPRAMVAHGLSRHQVPVRHVEQVSANCADMLTAPTLPDHSAKFPRRKVCSDPPVSPHRSTGGGVGKTVAA